jgi:hypothetical protein
MIQASQVKSRELIPKTKKAKWAGGMAQVGEHLPSKDHGLNSKPQYNQREKEDSNQPILAVEKLMTSVS